MKSNKFLLIVSSIALSAITSSTFAVTLSPASTQQVTVTVGAVCTVQAPPAASFGSLTANSATSADIDITNSAVVTCTNTPAILGIDRGVNGTATQRQMKEAGGAVIAYSVLESGVNPIGTTGLTSYAGSLGFTAPTYSVPASASPTSVSITVRLPAGTTPTIANAYTDTLSYYVQF